MSLIKRQASPAQADASRANSLLSTGPRTARGKATSSLNVLKPRAFSRVVARSMRVLRESPQDFEQMHMALAAAMAPRDGWEASWVQDIAVLRWRLERLQRAEAATVALRRRRLESERRRTAATPGGSAGLELKSMIGLVGFTGIPDSTLKFRHALEYFHDLRDVVKAEMFDQNVGNCIALLYGSALGTDGALLKARFEALAAPYREGHREAVELACPQRSA